MFSNFASAQNFKNDGKAYPFYCELHVNLSLSKIRAYVTWTHQKDAEQLHEENGEIKIFASQIDALNYMAKRGWELVESHVSPSGDYYVLRKNVLSDEEAKEGLHFRSEFKK